MSFILRKMNLKDIPTVMAIEDNLFDDPWTASQYKYEIVENPISKQLVTTYKDVVIGFLVYWITFDSSTICKIATIKDYQHQGVAQKLLDKMFATLVDENVITSTLEVRISNTAAISFYKKNEYELVTTKDQYYANGESAYYMMRMII